MFAKPKNAVKSISVWSQYSSEERSNVLWLTDTLKINTNK